LRDGEEKEGKRKILLPYKGRTTLIEKGGGILYREGMRRCPTLIFMEKRSRKEGGGGKNGIYLRGGGREERKSFPLSKKEDSKPASLALVEEGRGGI